MSHLEITYTVITLLVLLLAWAGMALRQPSTQDIDNATKPYKEWLNYQRMISQPKSWSKFSHLRFHPSTPYNSTEPEAITKLMEEINRNWEQDIESKNDSIKTLENYLVESQKELKEAESKLATLDKELKEHNHTSIELLLAEKAQRESIDEIERAEKELTPKPPKKKYTIGGDNCFSWVEFYGLNAPRA